MAKVKTFYSKKGYGNIWKPLPTDKFIAFSEENRDFDIIQIIMELINLYGLLFPTKVPYKIIVNGSDFYLTTQHRAPDSVLVGYQNATGRAYKFFISKTERKAKKALKDFLKAKNII